MFYLFCFCFYFCLLYLLCFQDLLQCRATCLVWSLKAEEVGGCTLGAWVLKYLLHPPLTTLSFSQLHCICLLCFFLSVHVRCEIDVKSLSSLPSPQSHLLYTDFNCKLIKKNCMRQKRKNVLIYKWLITLGIKRAICVSDAMSCGEWRRYRLFMYEHIVAV